MKKREAGIFSGNIFGGSGMGQTTSTSTTPALPDAAPDSLFAELATGSGGGSKTTTTSGGGGKSVSSSFDTSSYPAVPAATPTNYTPLIIGGVAVVGLLGVVMLMSGRRSGTVAANRRRSRRPRRNRRRSRR